MPQQPKIEPQTREIASARKTITEQDKQLASSAYGHFKKKELNESLQELSRLLELRPHDPRVSANKAIIEYYKSNLCKTDEFIKLINASKKQLEFGMVNTGDELDDIDRSFILYNQAILHFHMKQYKTAINILERLFKIIEPLGDVLAMKVCILLIEAYLLNNQLEQAHGMITYIENVMIKPKTKDEENSTFSQSKLCMFKVRLYMMRGFYGQCKRELKLAMNNSDEALFLKSNVECLRLNFQKAIKLLNSSPKQQQVVNTGNPIPVFYYNNMAAVHFAMKKYNMASMYGVKAIDENCTIMKSLQPIEKFNQLSGRPLHTLAVNKRAELLYNTGLSLLYSNQPAQAFECFIEAQETFQCNPRFWLRLAECSIAAIKQDKKKQESSTVKKSDYVRGVIGSGTHRKIVLSPQSPPKQPRQDLQSAAIPAPTLEFANLCLCNSMLLLLPYENTLESSMAAYLQHEKVIIGEDEKEMIKRSTAGKLNVEAPPGMPIQTKEAYSLRASILCCHTYVALELGDYYKSLEYSCKLLGMQHISAVKRFLGYIYVAESLLKLNRVSEAIKQLSPDQMKPMNTFDEEITELKTDGDFPMNLNASRSVVLLNLASAYSVRGEYDKAKHLLKQIMSNDPSFTYKSQAILLSVYCELQQGKVGSALELIKRSEVFSSGRLIDRVEAARASAQPTALTNMLPPRPMGGFTSMGNLPNGGSDLPTSMNNLPPVGGGSSSLGGIPYPPPGNLQRSNSGIFNNVVGMNTTPIGMPIGSGAPIGQSQQRL